MVDLDLVQQPVGDGSVVQPPKGILEGRESPDVALDAFRRMWAPA